MSTMHKSTVFSCKISIHIDTICYSTVHMMNTMHSMYKHCILIVHKYSYCIWWLQCTKLLHLMITMYKTAVFWLQHMYSNTGCHKYSHWQRWIQCLKILYFSCNINKWWIQYVVTYMWCTHTIPYFNCILYTKF